MRKWFELMLADQEDLAPLDDDRAGEAPCRVDGRSRLGGRVPGMLRRGRGMISQQNRADVPREERQWYG